MLVTVDVLIKKLQPISKKWYIIGSQLKIPHRKLNFIVNKNRNAVDQCLTDVCEEWVRSGQEVAWPKVVDALKSSLVDEKELACDIEREFCWVESNNSKTWVRISLSLFTKRTESESLSSGHSNVHTIVTSCRDG